jgi:WD40 repeat protein
LSSSRREPSTSISALLSELAESPSRAPEELLPELRPGDVVAGRFELLRELGRGGFGLVFEAMDRELSRAVAFKAIRPGRTRALEKLAKPLKEEAEAAARLNHPNVVTLHDSGVHEGTPYLIMELLRGETLAARLRRGPLAPGEALRVALEVAHGLQAAHAAGVLHRDLKPGNVFLTEQGTVKLVDFGLASIMGRAALAAGTPAYMAPEQLRAEPEDARTDVYGAAAVLYESLAGALPYPVASGRSAVLDPGPPPPPPLPDAPPELVALLASALARDPSSRPQHARAWLDGLLRVEQAYAARAAREAAAARRGRLRRAVWALGAVAVVLAAGVTGVALRARAAAERALRESRLLASAEAATDPLLAVLLLAELSDPPPARAVDVAQRVLAGPIPAAVLEGARHGAAVAVSPDGAFTAAALRDGGVVVYRTDGLGAPLQLRHEGRRVDDLAFTPDGARLLAAGHEGTLHLHRLDGGGPVVSIPLGGSPLVRLRISPDGTRAAVAALDGRLVLLALDPARVVATTLHDAPVLALAFSARGDQLATADAGGELQLLDPVTGAVRARRALGEPTYALAWSPGDGELAVAGAGGVVRRFGDGLEPLGALKGGGAATTALAFDPASRRLAAAGVDGTLRLYPAAPGAEPVRLRVHREPFTLAWAPAGGRILTFGVEGQAFLWSGAPEPVAQALEGPAVVAAAFTPDGGRVVTRSRDGSLRVWPVGDAGARGLLVGHQKVVDTVTWSRDGRRLLTAGHDGTARAWDRASGRQLLEVTDPSKIVHSAAWDPAERRILTSSEDGVARIWSADDGALLLALPPAGAPVLFAAWSPDGARVATAGLDGVIRIHRADGRGAPQRLEGHEAGVTHVAFSPDGREVVSASQLDATVRLWPLDGGPPRLLRADRAVFRAGLSPRGDLLAVAEIDGALRLFRAADLGELPPLRAWPERLWVPAWSPDQRLLALASFDGSVRVAPLDGQGEPLVLRGHQGAVTEVAFSPDGRELAIASADGSILIAAVDWPLVRQRLVAATSACLAAAQRLHLLGESEEEARDRFLDCERRHGREPAPPPLDRGPAAPTASGAPVPASSPPALSPPPSLDGDRAVIDVHFPPFQFTGTFTLAAGGRRDSGVARDRGSLVVPEQHVERVLEGALGTVTLRLDTELRGAIYPRLLGRWVVVSATGAWAGLRGGGRFTSVDGGGSSRSPFERQTLLGRLTKG